MCYMLCHQNATFHNNNMYKQDQLRQFREQYKSAKDEHTEEQKQLFKNQSELDALNATLRQVELYNEEMKSEIAVTRRATYKAEENVGDLEKGKKAQDLFIDTLNEQLKALHERLALYEAQLISQKQETGVSRLHGAMHAASRWHPFPPYDSLCRCS